VKGSNNKRKSKLVQKSRSESHCIGHLRREQTAMNT